MKKTFCFLALAALLNLTSGCKKEYCSLYVLGNQTEKELIIYPPYYFEGEDSTVLAPGEFFKIGRVDYSNGNGFRPEYFYQQQPLYISMDGIKYQIDRNDPDNCLWTWNYHAASQEVTAALLTGSYDYVSVFYLTEDYIQRQIVVNE